MAAVKKRNTRNKIEQRSLPWLPMFISFAVGGFVMFLIHLNENVKPIQTPDKKEVAAVAKKPKGVQPTFEFYSLLPEVEVVVNDLPKRQTSKPSNTVKPSVKPKPIKEVGDASPYLLQVGSFRKFEDAEGFKARLAFLGIESKVQTVTIDNKVTWHRVQVGPIKGRENADTVKKQLKQNKIDSLLVRIKLG